MMSFFLHLYFRLSRGLTLGVRIILQNHEDEYILVRHTYTKGWHLPGGGVGIGQTAFDAAIRELREEIGLNRSPQLRLSGIFLNSQISPRDHIILFYSTERIRKSDVYNNCLEIAEIGWFTVKNLPVETERGTRIRIFEHDKKNNGAAVVQEDTTETRLW